MVNFDVVAFAAPPRGEEIGNKTAMAFFGAGFGAQQDELGGPACGVQRFRNAASFHEGEEANFVRRPVFRLAIGLEKLGSGCEKRLVNVRDSRNLLDEIGEVGMLGVAGELAAAMLANVDELLNSHVFEEGKKILRCFSSEADGAKEVVHGGQKYSMASGEVRKANSLA